MFFGPQGHWGDLKYYVVRPLLSLIKKILAKCWKKTPQSDKENEHSNEWEKED